MDEVTVTIHGTKGEEVVYSTTCESAVTTLALVRAGIGGIIIADDGWSALSIPIREIASLTIKFSR